MCTVAHTFIYELAPERLPTWLFFNAVPGQSNCVHKLHFFAENLARINHHRMLDDVDARCGGECCGANSRDRHGQGKFRCKSY